MNRFDPVIGVVAVQISAACRARARISTASSIAHLADASPSVLLVSASDKLHNARSILSDFLTAGAEVWSRFNGGRYGTLWYYRALVRAFEARGRSTLTAAGDRMSQRTANDILAGLALSPHHTFQRRQHGLGKPSRGCSR